MPSSPGLCLQVSTHKGGGASEEGGHLDFGDRPRCSQLQEFTDQTSAREEAPPLYPCALVHKKGHSLALL